MAQLCIYCQKNEATTDDHITLSGMYAEPLPSNLITVPACLACNREFMKDDEYFLRLAVEWRASECDDGRNAGRATAAATETGPIDYYDGQRRALMLNLVA